jgi:hypothetical protein
LVEGYLLGEDIYPSANLRREIQMEKTIKYLLQEAYVNGYNDARISIADELEKAMYYIPNEYMEDTGSGIPHAYTEGITNGRNQALEIIRGNK